MTFKCLYGPSGVPRECGYGHPSRIGRGLCHDANSLVRKIGYVPAMTHQGRDATRSNGPGRGRPRWRDVDSGEEVNQRVIKQLVAHGQTDITHQAIGAGDSSCRTERRGLLGDAVTCGQH